MRSFLSWISKIDCHLNCLNVTKQFLDLALKSTETKAQKSYPLNFIQSIMIAIHKHIENIWNKCVNRILWFGGVIMFMLEDLF